MNVRRLPDRGDLGYEEWRLACSTIPSEDNARAERWLFDAYLEYRLGMTLDEAVARVRDAPTSAGGSA